MCENVCSRSVDEGKRSASASAPDLDHEGVAGETTENNTKFVGG